MPSKERISETFRSLQDEICEGVEKLDGKAKFHEDTWERPGGGGGRTRVISHGDLLEKGGVNFSEVSGNLPEEVAREYGSEVTGFFATGISIVLHPNNPFVPIIHMNVRYFEMEDGRNWFGGGIDLTPHYIVREDAQVFHQQLKDICDSIHPDFYDAHSKWADEYFCLKHRNESRGVGGVFYDRLEPGKVTKEQLFDYAIRLSKAFVPIYATVANKYRDQPFNDQNKRWQKLRRGRYVEFNLVWDRGTRFGLLTSGRVESILMSLPEEAMWLYDYHPEENSAEAETLKLLSEKQEWLKE